MLDSNMWFPMSIGSLCRQIYIFHFIDLFFYLFLLFLAVNNNVAQCLYIFFITFFCFVCSLSRKDPDHSAVQTTGKQPQCCCGGKTSAAVGLLALLGKTPLLYHVHLDAPVQLNVQLRFCMNGHSFNIYKTQKQFL